MTVSKSALKNREARAKHRTGDTEPYSLYSLRDAGGTPRYIGISRRLQNRFKSHARTHPDLFPVVLMTGISPLDAFNLERDLQAKLLPLLRNRLSGGTAPSPHRYKTYREYREWIATRGSNTLQV